MKAKFIAVEGLEGAGKTTAIDTISNYLSKHGVERFITTREPGGTAIAEQLRGLIKGKSCDEFLFDETELLLMMAARVQLINHVILPALAEGTWVIIDRFELSTFAYQGAGRGMPTAFIQSLSANCVKQLKPDITFYLDVDPGKGLERVCLRGGKDRIESESLAFFTRIRDYYREAVANDSNAISIDANLPLECVQKALIHGLEQNLE